MKMRRMLVLILVALVCAATSSAWADPPAPSATKLAKIHQLLELSHFADSVDKGRAICVGQMLDGLYAPDNYARDHGNYRGFKPGTPEWPKVVAAFKLYADNACSYYVTENLEPSYIRYYDSVLSEADLDAYLAFEKTPAAQHMIAAQAGAQDVWAAAIKEAGELVAKAADEKFAQSLSAICQDQPWYQSIFCAR